MFYDDLTNNEEFQRYKSQYNIQLTKEQDRAVQSVEGAVLLLAVPGSGKTSTMIARLGYMVLCKGISPENILVISYTNAAADELRRRMTSTFNLKDGSNIKIATINSFCLEIINQYSLIKNKKNPYNLKPRQSSLYEFFSKRKNINLTKSELIEYDTTIGYIKNMMLFENEDELAQVDSDRIYKEYVNYCKENNYMDYDDQLIFAYKILLSAKDIRNTLENKYRYISVDEAQDNSKLQHEIIRLIAEKNNNIFMVGDEDQSIFGFRGAYPRALLKFRNTYKNTFNLQIKRNFRSTANIIETANRFIEVNTDRETKKMVPVKEAGNQVIIRKVASRSEQFQDLVSRIKNSTNQIAILARLNDSLIPLINLLVENNIPYRINKEYQLTFFNSKNYTNLMNRLNFMNQNTKPTDAIAEIAWSTDVINRNYLDNMYIISENYETINDFKNRLLVLQKEVEKSNTEKDITAPIVLSTIHSSKGMEFNEVYLIDVYDGIFPLSNSKSNYYSTEHEMEQEERRLFYVGLTRAINSLNIFCINNRESCFVNELYSDSGSVGVSHGSNNNYKMDLIDHIRKINEEIHKKIAEREKAEHERRIAEFYEKQKAIEEEQRIKLEQDEQLRIKQENERKAREEDKKRKKRELDEECYQYALQCFEDGQLSMFGVQEPARDKVIDRTGRRWFRCIYCNEIKPEAEIWTYGGSLGLRDGKCKMCQKNGNS